MQSVGEDAIFDIYFADHPVQNYRDGLAANPAPLGKLNTGLLERGIIKSWPQKFYPSIAHTDEDVDQDGRPQSTKSPQPCGTNTPPGPSKYALYPP